MVLLWWIVLSKVFWIPSYEVEGKRWKALDVKQPNLNARQNASLAALCKGVCFVYSESQCKWATNCKYHHECFCFGNVHPKSKKANQSSQSQSATVELLNKSDNASKAVKNTSLVRGLAKQGYNSDNLWGFSGGFFLFYRLWVRLVCLLKILNQFS